VDRDNRWDVLDLTDGFSEYRWPLLCCVWRGDDVPCFVSARRQRGPSPAPTPGNVAAKAIAKINRGLMQGQLRGGCPKLEVVTVTVATMARVAADCHVHRERATMLRRGFMQRTPSVPLHPRSTQGLEPKQAQDLLHRDLCANSVEVDAWHGCSSLADTMARCSFDRSIPFLSMGNGNGPRRLVSPGVADQRACGEAGRLARATPAPRPSARS
jgi:hypothetical protein